MIHLGKLLYSFCAGVADYFGNTSEEQMYQSAIDDAACSPGLRRGQYPLGVPDPQVMSAMLELARDRKTLGTCISDALVQSRKR